MLEENKVQGQEQQKGEKKENPAKDDEPKGTKPKGESSSQPQVPTPTPPEKEPEDDKEEEEKDKVKKAEKVEITEEDKQKGEEEKQENQAKDDKLKGTKKEKMQEGDPSSQEEGESSSQGNIIYPRDFEITWGKAKDKTYWKLPPDKSSKDPAELKQVCWLQVTGSKEVERGKSYEIKFNISFKDDAFGWKGLPLFLMAKIGEKGKCIWKKIKPLEQTKPNENFDIPNTEEKFIVEIPADKGDEEPKLFFGLYEIWSNKWKGGLLINYATVEEVRKGK